MTDLERAQEIVTAACAEWMANSEGGPFYGMPAKNIVMREHIAKALAEERERCAKTADGYALSAADSAQVVLANAAEAARNAEPGRRQIIAVELKDKHNYLHGKRHCAVEIARQIRGAP